MRLAVDAKALAIRIRHHRCIVMGLSGALKNTDRKHHTQFLCQRRKTRHRGMMLNLVGILEKPRVLFDAEIITIKKFLQQDELRPLPGRIAHQLLRLVTILLPVIFRCHLRNGHSQSAHFNSLTPQLPV
jgi:hypothetical protein